MAAWTTRWVGPIAGLVLVAAGSAWAPAAVRAQSAGQTAEATVVGTWVVHPDPQNPQAQEVASFVPGGVMLTSSAPYALVAPGDQPPFLPTGATRVLSSQGYGAWSVSGNRAYAFRFDEIQYNEQGDYVFTIEISGRFTVDAGGNTGGGTYTAVAQLPDGSSMPLFGPSPFTATRMTAG